MMTLQARLLEGKLEGFAACCVLHHLDPSRCCFDLRCLVIDVDRSWSCWSENDGRAFADSLGGRGAFSPLLLFQCNRVEPPWAKSFWGSLDREGLAGGPVAHAHRILLFAVLSYARQKLSEGQDRRHIDLKSDEMANAPLIWSQPVEMTLQTNVHRLRLVVCP